MDAISPFPQCKLLAWAKIVFKIKFWTTKWVFSILWFFPRVGPFASPDSYATVRETSLKKPLFLPEILDSESILFWSSRERETSCFLPQHARPFTISAVREQHRQGCSVRRGQIKSPVQPQQRLCPHCLGYSLTAHQHHQHDRELETESIQALQ